MLAKFKAGPNGKSKVLGKIEQEQEQHNVIVIKSPRWRRWTKCPSPS